jgi:hypothetical protein
VKKKKKKKIAVKSAPRKVKSNKRAAPRVSRKPLRLDDQRNVAVLLKLITILRGRRPVTSHDISQRMSCSNMVARRRLQQLTRCGLRIRVGNRRVGERGPEARTYTI